MEMGQILLILLMDEMFFQVGFDDATSSCGNIPKFKKARQFGVPAEICPCFSLHQPTRHRFLPHRVALRTQCVNENTIKVTGHLIGFRVFMIFHCNSPGIVGYVFMSSKRADGLAIRTWWVGYQNASQLCGRAPVLGDVIGKMSQANWVLVLFG